MGFPKFKLILGISFILLKIPTLVFSNPYPPKTHGDALLIGSFIEPTIINPILTHSSISAILKNIIFDGLIKLNEKMEPVPHLALSWKNSPNGLTWIFHLRRDVKFHDGTELTAEDVKFTFDKINDPSISSPYLSIFNNFKTVRVNNNYTVEIRLKNPLPSLPFYLDVGILPKHILMGKDLVKTEFNYHPVGTGPFKMQSWSEDEIVLKANEAYFEGAPHLSIVKVKFFENQTITWAESIRENVDFVFPPYSKNYNTIKKIPNFKIYSYLSPYYYILAFNGRSKYFDRRKVRLALNYAVDKERILTRVLRGKGQISYGAIYPLSWVYSKVIEPYQYNPKKALILLEKAGWRDTNGNHLLDKDGKEFQFTLLILIGDRIAEETSLLIQQQLLDIGIKVIIKAISLSEYLHKFRIKDFDAGLLFLISDDPDKNYIWWHSSQIENGFNVFSYRNEKVDELLDKGRITLDREERKKIYYQFQREIYEDPPGIFLFWRDYLIGIHKRFKGVKISPAGIFSNINEWYVPKEEQKYR